MLKYFSLLAILCPLLSFASENAQTPLNKENLPPWLQPNTKDSDPRPSGYPTMGSHDPVPHKMEFFHDTRHWYICFDDGKAFMHDPDCPCHTSAKYVTYEMDKDNVEINETKRVTYQLPRAWDWR